MNDPQIEAAWKAFANQIGHVTDAQRDYIKIVWVAGFVDGLKLGHTVSSFRANEILRACIQYALKESEKCHERTRAN